MKRILFILLPGLLSLSVFGQNKYTPQEYEKLKASGTLPPGNHTIVLAPPSTKNYVPKTENRGADRGTSCGCYVEPDGSYTVAMAPNDDGSTGLITLPFTFCLYGDNYTSLYINNNGNVSFGAPYGTFSSNPFPDPTYVMVAPFWGDVDTRNGLGQVVYKIYPNAIYVNWEAVGYYSMHGDKLNTFQLILTDGSDPFVGIGNNVAFCYQDMQWTTGDASQGVNGFGGVPSTVGSNRGNGIDFVQFGRFDQPGTAYDGPFGLNDEVSWLDFATFKFNTCVSGSNVAPILSGVQPSSASGSGSGIACGDTLQVCGMNDTLVLSASFIAPENGQTITITANAPTLTNFTVLSSGGGTITMMVVTTPADAGFNQIDIMAADNGTPPMTTLFPITVFIDTTGVGTFTPVFTGPDGACAGNSETLGVQPGYDQYLWSTGDTTNSIVVNTPGQYWVTVEENGCFASAVTDFEIWPLPTPEILGAQSGCGDSTLIYVDSSYVTYVWSNSVTDSSQWVSSGTYTVTVTDTNGCTGTSPTATVALNPYPVADFEHFDFTGTTPYFVNDTIGFLDSSTISAGNIVGWLWTFGDGDSSFSQFPSNIYTEPGSYTVTLIVTSAMGCTDTISYTVEILPLDIVIPNVFSPGASNGFNDKFVIENIQYYPNSFLQVYNRWGQVVFEHTNYNNEFDGKHFKNNKPLPDATYYYILVMEDGTKYNGTVTIFTQE
ncbi:MAG: nidogen-like domain-containing protein [Bacteroidota bacterium]